MTSKELTEDTVSITQLSSLFSMLLTLSLFCQSTLNQTNATSTEKSMEPVEDHQTACKVSPQHFADLSGRYSVHFSLPPQIDRLSLLPNELLDHIFDLAYSIDTPSTGALSKRLLPFHITGIYRRIHLAKGHNIDQLIRTIHKSEKLGQLVQSLQLRRVSGTPVTTSGNFEIGGFLYLLTRLDSLDLSDDEHGWLYKITSYESCGYLPRLRHIISAPDYHSLFPLLAFTAFPALRSLSVIDYEVDAGPHDTQYQSPLQFLTHLDICGLYADDLSIASFCVLCPSLTHLTLRCKSPDFFPLLRYLPSTLVELRLESTNEETDQFCDRGLPHFKHLRHLHLGPGMFTYSLPIYLLDLEQLESIELGEGRVSLGGMRRLILELPSLRRLGLDLIKAGAIGTRMEVDQGAELQGKQVPTEDEWIARDWDVPDFDASDGEGFTTEAVQVMLQLAREHDVEVKGSILEAIEVMDVCSLEFANVAIYRSYCDKAFDVYREAHQHGLTARLPPLNLDSLDPNNLRLVKTDLPDEGWFALTLE